MSARHSEVGGSDGAPLCPADDKGREDPFALFVLIGCVEYAPDGGRGELIGTGLIPSGILSPRPDPEDCGVGWGGASTAGV